MPWLLRISPSSQGGARSGTPSVTCRNPAATRFAEKPCRRPPGISARHERQQIAFRDWRYAATVVPASMIDVADRQCQTGLRGSCCGVPSAVVHWFLPLSPRGWILPNSSLVAAQDQSFTSRGRCRSSGRRVTRIYPRPPSQARRRRGEHQARSACRPPGGSRQEVYPSCETYVRSASRAAWTAFSASPRRVASASRSVSCLSSMAR